MALLECSARSAHLSVCPTGGILCFPRLVWLVGLLGRRVRSCGDLSGVEVAISAHSVDGFPPLPALPGLVGMLGRRVSSFGDLAVKSPPGMVP